MPAVRKGESRKDYMARCVPYLMKNEGHNNNKSAVGKCEGLYDQYVKASASIKATDLQLIGEVEIVAAEDATKEPVLFLLANTGKPMDLTGFEYPVVIDMKGAYFDKKTTPIIIDHETNKRFGHTLDQAVVPAGASQMVGGKSMKGPMIAAVATRSSEMEIAKGITADARKGFPFQTSVGAKIVKGFILEEGDTAEVNGKTWSGPMIVASKTRIREISITVLGADNETSAVVVAKRKKENDMDFEAWLKALGFEDPSTIDESVKKNLKAKYDAEIKAAETEEDDDNPPKRGKKGKKAKAVKGRTLRRIKAADPIDDDDEDEEIEADEDEDAEDLLRSRRADEFDRIESIGEVATKFKDVTELEIDGKKLNMKAARKMAIKQGWSADTFELHCRRADYPTISGPGLHMVDTSLNNPKALEASILRYAGEVNSGYNKKNDIKFGLEAMYDAKTLDQSHGRQYQIQGSIKRLLALQVAAAGGHISHLTSDSDLMTAAHSSWQKINAFRGGSDIRANTFSSISVTNILENVMHKAAYSSFVMVESIWPFLCARRPVNDFKIHSLYRLDPLGHFRKVATDGQLKHVSMTDTKKTLQAETYGAMIVIDRKTQRNDDLGLIMDKARSIGSLGALRVEEAVFVLLLSNPSSFFSAGNGNLITGGGTALSISSLQTAQQKFRDQLINGKPIAVSPAVLLVGTNQEVLSNQLYNQAQMWITTTADTPKFANNPFAGRFTPHYTGYLNNTSITDQDGLTLSGQSTTQWYLFAPPTAPQGSALVIGFLDGRETPYFDEAMTEFSVPGGIQLRAYFDFAVAMHITQMALKSAGA